MKNFINRNAVRAIAIAFCIMFLSGCASGKNSGILSGASDTSSGGQSLFSTNHAEFFEVHHVLEVAQSKLRNTASELHSNAFPRSAPGGEPWKVVDASDWTSGFFPGCLWYMYEITKDDAWKDMAESWTGSLENQKNNTGTHDIGFMLFCSFGNGYRLTMNEHYKDVILKAAASLATRYHANIGCIRSWDFGSWSFPVIIDNMMNLELLFWASQNGGKAEWHDMALNHALRTMEDHIRQDGSAYHVVDYSPVTGIVIKKQTHQGYSNESAWARGQAWGIYGFTMAYRYTEDSRMLETAKRMADYFIENLPYDYIPPWDFKVPDIANEEKDSSAAAIAASGLLELSTYMTDTEEAQKYRNTAVNILKSLSSDNYLSTSTENKGILLHGVGHHPGRSEVDVSLIYGDYYFIEALLRYKRVIEK